MRHRVAVADLDFGAIFAADAEEGPDHAFLVCVAPQGVVEDAEEGLRLDCYGEGRCGGLGGDLGGAEGAGEVEEGVGGGHAGQIWRGPISVLGRFGCVYPVCDAEVLIWLGVTRAILRCVENSPNL